jgi:hypothetical protein
MSTESERKGAAERLRHGGAMLEFQATFLELHAVREDGERSDGCATLGGMTLHLAKLSGLTRKERVLALAKLTAYSTRRSTRTTPAPRRGDK